jgi:hypothetical protein
VKFEISVGKSQCKKKLCSRMRKDNIKTDHRYARGADKSPAL